MKTLYLDSSNDVICSSKIVRTLAEIQTNVNPNVVTVILNAPDQIVIKGKHDLYYHRHSTGDGTDISHYIQIDFFDRYKEKRFNQISKRTDEILKNGFIHDSHEFTLDINFRNQLGILADLAGEGLISYPIRVICKNEFETYQLANNAALRNLYIAMAQSYKQLMSSDVDLKKQIADATTKAEIDAVVDSR